jgi:hypothetical protein
MIMTRVLVLLRLLLRDEREDTWLEGNGFVVCVCVCVCGVGAYEDSVVKYVNVGSS